MNNQNSKVKKPKKRASMLNKFLSMLLLASLVFGGIALPENIFASVDVTDVLEVTKLQVLSDGRELYDTDTDSAANSDIEGKKKVNINMEIKVPVKSDDPEPPKYVEQGNTASIKLAEGFLAPDSSKIHALEFTDEHGDTKKVGDAHFEEQGGAIYLKIDFNGDAEVFTGWHNVITKVNADFYLNLEGLEPNQGCEKSVTILEKTYKLQVKAPENTIDIKKDGKVIPEEKAIEWTVTATVKDKDGKHGFLDTYVFEDDLSGVGEYVMNSMEITYTPEGGGGTNTITPTDPYDTANKKLIYTFVKDGGNSIQSPATIKFKTKLTDEQFTAYNNNESEKKSTKNPTVITNTAKLKKDSIEKLSTKEVTWDPTWIDKLFVLSPNHKFEYTVVGSDCFITWRVQLNTEYAKLNNVVVTDTLVKEIRNTVGDPLTQMPEYVSATRTNYKKDAGGNEVVDGTTQNIVPTESDPEYIFTLGDITGKVELDIKLKVALSSNEEAQKFFQIKQRLKNKAKITSDDFTKPIYVERTLDVGKGEINKSPDDYYAKIKPSKDEYTFLNYDTKWKISVLKENIKAGSKVYDMMIFDKNITYTNLKNITLEGGGDSIDGIKLEKLRPINNGFRQKYVGYETLSGSSLNVTTEKLLHSGKYVGDLIVIDGFKAEDAEKNRAVYLKSYVQDFSVVMNNHPNPTSSSAGNTTSWTNTVYLSDGTKAVAKATSWPRYMTRLLKKEALTRDAAATFKNKQTAANVNGTAVSDSEQHKAFNYVDKTATYRLSVNANKVHDLGYLVVTDTLPEGWDLVSYSVFKGDSKEQGGEDAAQYSKKKDAQVLASGDAVLKGEKANVATEQSSTDGDVKALYTESSREVKFTFPDIKESYVIILEAKVSDEKFKEYVKNGTNDIKNEAKVKFADYTQEIKAEQNIKIEPKVVLKDKFYSTPAELKWQLDYVPYNLVSETTAYIEDTLGANIEIRQGATKNSLLFKNADNSKNFQIYKLSVGEDNTLIEGDELAETDIENSVSYDADTKKLTFKIPKEDIKNAYRFYYITDLMGDVGMKAENTATLMATNVVQKENPKAVYSIVKADVDAMASKRAFIEVTKTDNSGNLLRGARFTLVNKTGTPDFNQTMETGDNGIARFQGMNAGEYTLKETQAPSGYKLNPTEYTVKVEEIIGRSSNVKIANIEGKDEGDPKRITIVNEDVSGGIGGGSSSGGSSSSSKPKPPTTTPPTTTPPTTSPAETPPVVTPETPTPAPSTPATPTPTPGEGGYPRYPRAEVPDPNDPSSPEIITVIDENGVPLGNYQKQKRPDGTMEYVIMDENVPLAHLLPKTGENPYLLYLYLMTGTSMAALGFVLLKLSRRKRKHEC